MDDRRPADQVTDAALEREIERALAVEPSPAFLARVRAQVAAAPEPAGWGVPWGWLGIGAAAVGIALTLLILRPSGPPPALQRERSPVVAALPAPAPARPAAVPSAPLTRPGESPIREAVGPRRAAVPRGGSRPTIREPEVLVAAGEAAAWRRLMRGLRQGTVEPSTGATATTGIQPIEPRAAIVLAPLAPPPPIVIEPLGIGHEGGVRQ